MTFHNQGCAYIYLLATKYTHHLVGGEEGVVLLLLLAALLLQLLVERGNIRRHDEALVGVEVEPDERRKTAQLRKVNYVMYKTRPLRVFFVLT